MNIILEELNEQQRFSFVRTDYKNQDHNSKSIDKKRAYDLEVSNTEIGRTLEILLAEEKLIHLYKGEEYYVILQEGI